MAWGSWCLWTGYGIRVLLLASHLHGLSFLFISALCELAVGSKRRGTQAFLLISFPRCAAERRGKWWSLKGVSSQASNMDPNSITYAYLIIIKSGDKIKYSYETIAKFILMKDILWIKHKEGQRKVGDIWWNVESNKRGMVVMVKAMMTASSFPVH